ncbi:unnamed protein product, partial [Polarella glacialis]
AGFHTDGFVLARGLAPGWALDEAWGAQGALGSVSAGRFSGRRGVPRGADAEISAESLQRLTELPGGLLNASDMNFVHNGLLLHGIRGLWPLVLSAAVGAHCLLGLNASSQAELEMPLLAGKLAPRPRPGLRLNAHLRLAPKTSAGGRAQHVSSHQDAGYWAGRFQHLRDLDAFANATVTAWIPLVEVGAANGALAYIR